MSLAYIMANVDSYLLYLKSKHMFAPLLFKALIFFKIRAVLTVQLRAEMTVRKNLLTLNKMYHLLSL